jgi:hypothetical protein
MSVETALKGFGDYVVQQSRSNLTKKDKNVSKELYNSIKYDYKVSPNSFELTISMVDYGKFIDKGVKGAKSSQKAPSSPYKYTNKMPPARVFDKWSVKRGFAGRDEKGRFISRKSINFAIARSIYEKGIETTNFFTTPFERAFKRLPEEVIQAYGLEVDSLLKTSLG